MISEGANAANSDLKVRRSVGYQTGLLTVSYGSYPEAAYGRNKSQFSGISILVVCLSIKEIGSSNLQGACFAEVCISCIKCRAASSPSLCLGIWMLLKEIPM